MFTIERRRTANDRFETDQFSRRETPGKLAANQSVRRLRERNA
jgi:hypothetical protein